MKRNLLRVFPIVLAAVFTMLSIEASAQQSPIRWRTSVELTSPTEGIITLRALIDEGWHLYGFDLPDDGPRPTAISLAASSDLELTGTLEPERAPIALRDEIFELDLQWWDADVAFAVPFRITGPAPTVKGTISFMACNDQTCQPPTTITIDLPIAPDTEK